MKKTATSFAKRMRECENIPICERSSALFAILKEALNAGLSYRQENYIIRLRNSLKIKWGISR